MHEKAEEIQHPFRHIYELPTTRVSDNVSKGFLIANQLPKDSTCLYDRTLQSITLLR